MLQFIKKATEKPYLILPICWQKCSKLIFSDKLYLGVYYRLCLGKKLDLKHPKAFTEKIQWLKLHNTTPLCSMLVDKYAVREYVKDRIGEEYLVPLLGVWNRVEDIDYSSLPLRFVLKTTHDSGGVVICRDKNRLDIKQANRILKKSLSRNYFWKGREYPYKNVKPRIIAEQFMEGEDRGYLVDFKFFCFDGEPRVLFYASNRYNEQHTPPRFDYYDMELNHLPVKSKGHENSENELELFPEFEQMKEIARKLSDGFPHVRVDLFISKGRIFFGEMTFHHDGGLVPFIPDEWDLEFGKMIKLPINE